MARSKSACQQAPGPGPGACARKAEVIAQRHKRGRRWLPGDADHWGTIGSYRSVRVFPAAATGLGGDLRKLHE
jgi:hypothetical protein